MPEVAAIGTPIPTAHLSDEIRKHAIKYRNKLVPDTDPNILAHAVWNRLVIEGTIARDLQSAAVPKDSPTGATGVGQFFSAFTTDTNQITGLKVNYADLKAGKVPIDTQIEMTVAGFANYMKIMKGRFKGVTDPYQVCELTSLAYNLGPGGMNTVAKNFGDDPNTANFTEFLKFAKVQAAIANKQVKGNVTDGAQNGGPAETLWTQTPTGASAAVARPLTPDLSGVTPIIQPLMVTEGLDAVPWWELEGAILGNRRLRQIPDAVSFKIHLRRDTGEVLRDSQGRPIIVRLNVGLKTLSSGSSHQNTTTPTGSGLLVNIWDAKPDIVTASGTTGVFMNQLGLTSIMSSKETAETLNIINVLKMAYVGSPRAVANVGRQENAFRVVAQDAFMELLALFKNNGIVRYLPRDLLYGTGTPDLKSEQATASGLSGYQARRRVGDVMAAGFVAMTYKGRTMLGQFKQLEWSASAESPYRWDFSFTFRVISDFSPYYLR